MRWKSGLIGLFLWMMAAVSQAWDNGGHLLINEITSRHLRPEAARQIEPLLPLLDTRGHDGQPYDFVSAGTWMDDLRAVSREWSRWHYVDVPCAGETFVEPQPPHALWALDRAVEVLRSRQSTPQVRAEALGQVMHLVADIHQPLHTASCNGDRGGNEVAIMPPVASQPGPANLHAFWDAAYRYDAVGAEIDELWPKYFSDSEALKQAADQLIARVPGAEGTVNLAAKPWHQWARETHALACQSGWPGGLPPKGTPVALSPAFVHRANEIAAQQVVRAGVRLAGVLNQAFAPKP